MNIPAPVDLLEAAWRALTEQPKREDDSVHQIADRLRTTLDIAVPAGTWW